MSAELSAAEISRPRRAPLISVTKSEVISSKEDSVSEVSVDPTVVSRIVVSVAIVVSVVVSIVDIVAVEVTSVEEGKFIHEGLEQEVAVPEIRASEIKAISAL